MTKTSTGRRVWVASLGVLFAQSMLLGAALSPGTAQASAAAAPAAAPLDPVDQATIDALDQGAAGGVRSADLQGDPRGLAILDKPMHDFPSEGSTALILSTGDASVVARPASSASTDKTQFGDDLGVDLDGAGGADGNDLTQLKLELAPPAGASCLSFDFMFLSEEFPRYKGDRFNDIFTAELDTSTFTLNGAQVEAPNNFAFSADKEVLSINGFNKFVKAPKSSLNGRSEKYSATAPLGTTGAPSLILSVQDLGDSIIDSAVVVDNLRYIDTAGCTPGTDLMKDTDGDALPDVWETKGVDLNRDGKIDLDLPAMGADPLRKDIFLEIDWMFEAPACAGTGTAKVCAYKPQRDKTPDPIALQQVADAFAAAPVSNPDGTQGITLHLDAGPDSLKADGTKWGKLAGGNSLPWEASVGDSNTALKRVGEIRDTNMDQARLDVFHYVVYGNTYGDNDSSGYASLPGAKVLLTDGLWNCPTYATSDPQCKGFTLLQEAGTLMHELGHNLKLDHGGDVGTPYKPGYYSVMNYEFQTYGIGASKKIDYSTGAMDYQLPLGDIQEHRDAGRVGKVPALDKFNDWSYLVYNGDGIGAAGSSTPESDGGDVTELDLKTAVENDLIADGDGAVALVGPTLVAQGVEQQVLIADITNMSSVETTYSLSIDAPWAEPTTVTVAAGSTERAEIPLVVTGTGVQDVTASLYNGETLLSTSTIEVAAVDLDDAAANQEVQQTFAALKAEPLEGLDPGVVDVLNATIVPAIDGAEPIAAPVPSEKDESSSLPIPVWAIVLVAVAVLLLGLLLASRRGKSATA